jgi:lipopolysaccharide export LptBFGC system permease protein LptF
VLLLLGLPFVARPGQKSIAAGLGVALGTCAVYVASDYFCQWFGNSGELVPLVAAWLAPAFFGALALVRLDRVSA